MRFKLPKIQVFLSNSKKAPDNDPRKVIHVYNGYAIVSNDIIAIINLREFIKSELNIVDETDLKKLSEIISWMNGKAFNKQFWTELSKEVFVESVDPENDELEIFFSGFKNRIQWESIETDTDRVLKLLKHNLNREDVAMERYAVSGEHLNLISKAFASEMKTDNILFSLSGTSNAVKFSLANKDYIFGIIPESFSASMDIMAFDNTRTLFEVLESDDIDELDEDDEDFWNQEADEQF